MQRRNFLKGLAILPFMGFIPSSSSQIKAEEINGSTSGLNKIVEIIKNDQRLNKKVDPADIQEAIECAQRMNDIIIEAIINTGVANDKKISIADTREINNYIFNNYHDEWIDLHGNDEDDEESGFHKVVNDGAKTRLFGKNAINKVADGIYHLGFKSPYKNRLVNEDGNKNVPFKKVAYWLNSLLKNDLESGKLANPEIKEVMGETNTGLDKAIEIIYNDKGLQRKISTGDIREGAKNANEMNKLIIEAIKATGAAADGSFDKNDIKEINQYLVANYKEKWAILHGDDEENEESGFHKVVKDGAKTRLFGKNAINKVFDGIYHLGFETPYKNRLVNEDGNKNVPFKKVAYWLNNLLKDELANREL